MSENIDIPADVYDAENPKLKDLLDLEARQEQEETKEAKEGIASSSTNPTERAIDDAPSSIPQGLRSDAITASESGETNPTQVGKNLGFFLFEVFLSRMDVRSLERLLIPVEQAIGHFSPQAIGQENYEEKINISDPLNFHFSMKLRYDISESAFVLEKDLV
ncbi:Fibrinogen silencer-binding protein [Actinidia chinensis var. chinensis]|uniref:Fibrinogen silencer-binding protein n=1 Tax=Actinidia chinensis var. chinensis TaxID=1590841 RepID=A0A2R6QJQ9_ACTCC|nr:Fibrinogen silencer-binding protein [Actinidia chinensis var. chinensis]